jgi:hypothetical protein
MLTNQCRIITVGMVNGRIRKALAAAGAQQDQDPKSEAMADHDWSPSMVGFPEGCDASFQLAYSRFLDVS